MSDHVNSTPESLDMGGAPPRTDALIGPAACGRCPKPDSLKRRASARALSLGSLDSLEHGLNISCNSSSLANAGRTARWNLAQDRLRQITHA